MRFWLSALLSCSLPLSYGGKALRVGICGASGSGKTALLREILLKIPQQTGTCRNLVYAPYPGPYGRHCRTMGEIRASLVRRASTTIITDPELYRAVMPEVLARGEIMLVIDEAHELYPRQKPDPTMTKILREGRNLGVGLIWATQRPTACHTDLLGISQGIVIGRLIGLADIAYSRQWGVTDQPLPNYKFRVILPGMDHPPAEIESLRY